MRAEVESYRKDKGNIMTRKTFDLDAFHIHVFKEVENGSHNMPAPIFLSSNGTNLNDKICLKLVYHCFVVRVVRGRWPRK